MRLIHDRDNNALRLVLGDDPALPGTTSRMNGLVDVTAGGRLAGIELHTGDTEPEARNRLGRWLSDPVAGQYVTVEPDGTVYIELTAGEPGDDVRSSELDLVVETGLGGEMLAVSIPRRGAGYEISYPSGNR